MTKQKFVNLIIFILIPFFYPFCWWPMSFTGWVFWREPKNIVEFLWKEAIRLFRSSSDSFKIKDWFLLFLAIGLAHIPYLVAWKILRCIWIVYFEPYV
jgi:hypothetical protein